MLSSETWISVSYVPTVEDGLVYLRCLAANSPQVKASLRTNRRTAYFMAACILAPLFAAGAISRTPGGAWLEPYLHYGLRTVLVIGVMILLGLVWHFRGRIGQGGVIRRTLERQARSGDLELDLRPTTIAIGPDGITVNRGNAGAWHQWSAVQRIIESEQRYLVYWTRDQAIVVPLAAFESPEQAMEFYRLVESNLRRPSAGTNAPPTIPAKR